MNVELRGIYTTALTALLRDTDVGTVVNASDPIEDRFEEAFETAPPTVQLHQTHDRLGVGVHGPTAAVSDISEPVAAVSRDTLWFEEPAPRGCICTAAVDATTGGGAVVTLPDGRDGYLPYDETTDYVEVGDEYRVQVIDPQPPWSDRAPGVSTTLRVPGSIVTLERGHDGPTVNGETAESTALLRSMDLLEATAPEPWGVRWEPYAADASLAVREAALEAAAETAREIETALDTTAPLEHPVTPAATRWFLFGREARYALDKHRAAATQTIDGHHRIKAVGGTAATAVDFVEAVCDSPRVTEDTLIEQFGPAVGDTVTLHHGKPHGEAYSLGAGTVTAREGATVTVEREMTSRGTYDALGTERVPGDRAITRCVEGRWWYPTVYRGADDTTKGTYVNIATPLELYPDRIQYTDLYIDVVQRPDATPEIVDADELTAAVDAGDVPEELAEKAKTVARSVKRALA